MKSKLRLILMWIAVFFLIALILIFELYIIRALSAVELDDVTPGIECEPDLIEKSDILWVIPDFNNVSIATNKSWCQYILSLNKTIEMHGVYHTFNEFNYPRNEEYVYKGIKDFNDCFGFAPSEFKAPQMALSNENRKMLKGIGFSIRGKLSQVTHKAYHCNDSGAVSNKFMDFF